MTSGSEGAMHFEAAGRQGDRARPARGHQAGLETSRPKGRQVCGVPDFASKGFVFRDGSCLDCTEALPLTKQVWQRLVELVEHVAKGTDHIRIDLFFRGGAKDDAKSERSGGKIYVNEANISLMA